MEFKFTASVPVVLKPEDIDDIMVTALEGGITYWCDEAEVVGGYLGKYASEQISRGGTLRLHDAESSDVWDLTRDKFIEGVKLWLEDGACDTGALIGSKIDTGSIDAECADAIIQFALFGEVTFG